MRLQPLTKPSSRRKEAQGENALCLRAEVSVSDKCRGRLEKRVRYDRNMFFVVPRKATLYIDSRYLYIGESLTPFEAESEGIKRRAGADEKKYE